MTRYFWDRIILMAVVGLALSAGISAWSQEDAPPEGKLRLRGWFWFVGTSNYHVKLDASEALNDRLLNRPMNLLLPAWEEPTTFKDWSDDWRVWDVWAGVGREINDHLSWALYSGGGAGTIRNHDMYYPLGVPLRVKADYTRRSMFLGVSLSIYPWGRPEKGEPGFWNAVRAARPQFEANVGYNWQYALADVSFGFPVLGDLLNIEREYNYDLFFFSPRAGLEFPMTEKSSFNVILGYTLFHDHGDDFNSILLEFFVRNKF